MVKLVALVAIVTGCLSTPAAPSDSSIGPHDTSTLVDSRAFLDVPGTSNFLFGDMTKEPRTDGHTGGTAEASSFITGATSVTVTSLWVYYGPVSGNGTQALIAGLYDNIRPANPMQDSPSTLLTTGAITSGAGLAGDQWYEIAVPPVVVAPNTVYWIAAVVPYASPNNTSFAIPYQWTNAQESSGFCDATLALGCTQHSPDGTLTTLPTTWGLFGEEFTASVNSYYATGF